jgi:hypothetical protein
MKTEIYFIDCTGDACVGDCVCFERAIFSGSFRKPKFSHLEKIEAEIIKDSYGRDKQQHTFTLRLPDGQITLIKGRNLYRHGCHRRPWTDEALRLQKLDDKHIRGDQARDNRIRRKNTFINHDDFVDSVLSDLDQF